MTLVVACSHAPITYTRSMPTPIVKAEREVIEPRPSVFVAIEAHTGHAAHVPRDAGERIAAVINDQLSKTGYATSWPTGLPTAAELGSAGARGYIVTSNVQKVEIKRVGSQVEIACMVDMRVAPWRGRDGGERWEPNAAATGSGSARLTITARRVDQGVCECIEAAVAELGTRRMMPFLERIAAK
jgi:hypothetical protein